MLKTTWDGQPVTPDPPFGASVVVYRRTGDRLEFLVLHRALPGRGHGNWAWGSPAGARWPGEPIEQCARREALEETGVN